MTDALANHLIEVINWHRTWIMALDFGNFGNTVTASQSAIRKTPEAIFRLEVRIGVHGYQKGAVINVSERQIDKSISTLVSTDRGFHKRLLSSSLTFQDANLIFRMATWNVINLELED